jgi:uncharacterized membrane-anchored protein YitT (DUF2179 family)
MKAGLRSLFVRPVQFSWTGLVDYLLIFSGAFLQALAIRLFLVPASLVSGGVSGLAQIINSYTGWPIGLMIFIGNIPLFILGWRFLGGSRFALRTAFAIVVVSFFTDFLALFLPVEGITTDMVLNSLYGAVISGIGYGLVYRGRGTSGGTDILARILNHWRGVSISLSYLMTDALVILLAGLTFGWTNALYALVVLYVSGLAAEAITEGSRVARTALIVTTQPEAVTRRILHDMERGATILPGKGAYTGEDRAVLYVVISRSEVPQMKSLVHEEDPEAFMVIGQAYEALGEGFLPLPG